MSFPIIPSCDTVKTVERIAVTCAYEGNANIAYFDNISLVREVAQTMKYDSNGNLVSVTSTGLNTDQNQYDENSNLTKVSIGGSSEHSYIYNYTNTDYPHRLTSVWGYYLKEAPQYDTYGNVTSTCIIDLDDDTTPWLSAAATYSASGNLMTSETDVNGSTTTYTYGSSNNNVILGIPQTITDAMGTTVNQTIDEDGRITKAAIANTASLDYTYSDGNLTTVTRTDIANALSMNYTFTYDSWGNMLTAKAGNCKLASYTYGDNNGLLQKLTYGNGDELSYTYDILDRVKTKQYDNGQLLTYTYSGDGQLARVKENGGSAVRFYYYNYDSIGRLISSRMQRGYTTVLQTGAEYNADNQLVKQSWTVGTGTDAASYSETYTYNPYDGKLRTITNQDGNVLDISYDALRRLRSASNDVYTKSYRYRDRTEDRSTTQVSKLLYTDLAVPLTYEYTYNKLGNITSISDPLDGEKSYTYDKLGQMLSETIDDTTYTYTYDNVGNLLTADNSTGSHTYRYNHASWGDYLSHFDGQTISYDAIGNPTSYYNGTRWTMTWQNGRQLATASDGTSSISYEYEQATGLRVKKTIVKSVKRHRLTGFDFEEYHVVSGE